MVPDDWQRDWYFCETREGINRHEGLLFPFFGAKEENVSDAKARGHRTMTTTTTTTTTTSGTSLAKT